MFRVLAVWEVTWIASLSMYPAASLHVLLNIAKRKLKPYGAVQGSSSWEDCQP